MKFLIGLIFLLSQNSFAQISNGRTIDGTNAPGIDSLKNYIKNSDCAKNVLGITASGGSLTRGTTTPLNEDSGSECVIDASASGQTYTWALNTFGQGMKGQNCEARFVYEGDASLYKAYINNGATKITTDLQLESSTSVAKTVSINFPCGDLSASNTFVVESTSASAAAISVAKVYTGLATNLSNVAQAQFIGSAYFATTASCAWSRTNTSLGAFSTTAACPGPTVEFNPGPGTIQTTDTDLPQVTLNNLPPGNYMVQVDLLGFVGTAGNIAAYSISDGTNTSGKCAGSESSSNTDFISCTINSNFNYSSAQSSITFSLFGSAQAGTVNINNKDGLAQTRFSIYRFPSSSEIASRSASPQLPTIQKFTSGSGTYTTPIGAIYLRVRMVGGGGGGSGSSTSAANNGGNGSAGGDSTFGTSFITSGGGSGGNGTTQASGGNGGSATINSPAYGTALGGSKGDSTQESTAAGTNMGGKMGGATMFGGGGAGGASGVVAGGVPPTNSGAGGGGAGAPTSGISGSGGGGAGYIDAIIPNPASSYSYAVGAAGSGGGAGTGGAAGGNGAAGYIEVTEYYSTNTPLLIGSVTSSSTGLERIERANVTSACTGSPCIVASKTPGISSITRASEGVYQVVFVSGTFTGAPACTFAPIVGATTPVIVAGAGGSGPTSTTYDIAFSERNTPSNPEDAGFSVTCQGPR